LNDFNHDSNVVSKRVQLAVIPMKPEQTLNAIMPVLESATENIEFFELITASSIVVVQEQRAHFFDENLAASVHANNYVQMMQGFKENGIETVVFVPSWPKRTATDQDVEEALSRIDDVRTQLAQLLKQLEIQLKIVWTPTWYYIENVVV
jgi:primosomal protein N''